MVRRKSEPVERFEEFDVTNQDGIDFHVVRNVETGEQTITRIDDEVEVSMPKHAEASTSDAVGE